ncbi:MAG: tetratricopeptide repeat protein [Candidatus Heimdallarchaeota archaeon]
MSKEVKSSKKAKTKKASTSTTKKKTSSSTKKKTSKQPKKKPKQPKKEDFEADGIDDTLLLDGINYIEDNKLDTALEAFEAFSVKYPKNHFGWYYIGYTKMLQDKKKVAVKNFKKASKLNKGFIPSRYYEGLVEFENNNFTNALMIFDKIMDKFNTDVIKESNFNIPYFIGICHHYLGNLQRAEEYFLFAYNMSPDDPVVLYYKGFNELAMRNYDFAMETFKNLLMVDMNYQTFWDLVKGYSYFYHQEDDKTK